VTDTELWRHDVPTGTYLHMAAEGDQTFITCLDPNTEPGPPENPRIAEGLAHLWPFEEEKDDQVLDYAGDAHLQVDGDREGVQWLEAGGLRISAPVSLSASPPILATASGLTLEAWIQPAGAQHARVFSWAESKANINLELRQASDSYTILARDEPDGKPALITPDGSATPNLTHIVWTALDNANTIYLNSMPATTDTRVLAPFEPYPLIVANTAEGDRPFLGTIHLIAVYERNFRGLPLNPGAALLRYARDWNLGAPLTDEFTIDHHGTTYVVQGFAEALVFCPAGQWHQIEVVEW
jgi:hypothetical protein